MTFLFVVFKAEKAQVSKQKIIVLIVENINKINDFNSGNKPYQGPAQ
jgi:hypothetical protein